MVNPHVKDKDGVSTLAVFAEMTNELYGKGITLSQQIDQLYQKYFIFFSFIFAHNLFRFNFTDMDILFQIILISFATIVKLK